MPDDTQDLTSQDDSLDGLLAEYVAGEDAGQPQDRQAMLARHPRHAAELREFFANHDQMRRLAAPLRGVEAVSSNHSSGRSLGKLRYFGDYELLEEIAAGGMGIVYKARQVSLSRIVAVKMILKGTLASEDDVKRFQAEAEAAASLQHPAIVAIHEVGLHEGQHYFSMDFVEGHSLAQLPRDQPLSACQAAECLRDAAEAVHYAHQQGTLHRDLKPSNILIDRQGRVRITDFGLAKRIEGNSDLTLTGQILGTPSYMPPEQALGKRSLISAASDIYSLGAVLYELLTGRPPFRGESPVETLKQVEKLDPVSPRLLNPATPRDLETICLKCLEKEPHKRYGTAQLLADDLGRYLRGEPIVARPVGPFERTWRWCRRNSAVAGLIATVAACLILGTAVSTYFAIAEAFQRTRADDKAAEALREKSTAETARALSEQRKSEAEASAALAERRRKEAETSAKLARRHSYAAHMNLAQLAWENGWADQTAHLIDLFRLPPEQAGGATDFRGFEWFHWDRCLHSDVLTLKGQPLRVTSVSYSADGKQLASADFGGTVKFWDAATGQELRSLVVDRSKMVGNTITKYSVRCVAFSPDWKRMASSHGDPDHTVALWDAATGKEIMTLKGLDEWASCLAFSPDGTRLASVSNSRRLHVWNVTTGEELFKLNGNIADYVRSVVFSPDGTRLASTWNGTVHEWDATTGKELSKLKGVVGLVNSLAFNHNGTRLAAASFDQTVKIWDRSTGDEPRTLRGHTQPVECVAFSPDGKWLVSASKDHTIKVWDAHTGKESASLKGHSGAINAMAFSPDGQVFASASDDRSIKIWDPAASQEPAILKGRSLRRVVFSPDGSRLATASFDRTVQVWDAVSGQASLTLKHADQVRWLAYSPDGKRLASACEHGTIKLWDTASGDELLSLEENAGNCVEFSPDGKQLASTSSTAVKIWDAAAGAKLATLKGGKFGLACLAYSPDGTNLASAGFDRTIRLWDTATEKEVFTLTASTGIVGLAFSPDGKLLAAAIQDGTIQLWNVQTRQEALTLKAHSALTSGLVFSPDGNRLASSGSDGTTKLWDVATGQQLLSLPCGWPVSSVAFSPDGRRLASAGGDTVRIWYAATSMTHRQQFSTPLAHFRFNGDSRDEANANAVWELKNTEFRDNALYLSDKYEHNKAGDGYRAVCRTPSLNYNQFTVVLRFKAHAFDHPKSNLLSGGASTRWFGLRSSPAGNLTISLNNNEFTRELKDVALPKDKWTVVACGVDLPRSKVMVYLNGKQAADIDLPKEFKLRVLDDPRFKDRDKVWSFANYSNATIFHGLVDELIIYGSMLSQEELEKVPLRP